MVKRQFWTAFSLTRAVYLLGIAAAVWVIEPPEAPAAEPVREAVEYSPDPEEDLILLGVMEGEEPVVLLIFRVCVRQSFQCRLLVSQCIRHL